MNVKRLIKELNDRQWAGDIYRYEWCVRVLQNTSLSHPVRESAARRVDEIAWKYPSAKLKTADEIRFAG